MSAKESTLALIHELQAQEMLKILKEAQESGEPVSPQHLAQITKFLKDNSITSEPDENPALKEIQEKVSEESEVPFDVLNTPHPISIVK